MDYTTKEKNFSSLLLRQSNLLAAPAPPLFIGDPATAKKNHPEEMKYNSELYAREIIAFRLSLASLDLGKASDVGDVEALIDITTIATAIAYGDATLLLKQFGAWPLAAKQPARQQRDGNVYVEVPAAVPNFDYTYLFGVRVRRLVRGRVCKPDDRPKKIDESYKLAEAFNRLKRSAIKVSEVFQYKSLKGHGEDIGKQSPPLTEEQEGNTEHILQYVDKIVECIFKDGPMAPLKEVLPPATAAYDFSRKKGGAAVGVLDSERKGAQGIPETEDEIIMIHQTQWAADTRPEYQRVELSNKRKLTSTPKLAKVMSQRGTPREVVAGFLVNLTISKTHMPEALGGQLDYLLLGLAESEGHIDPEHTITTYSEECVDILSAYFLNHCKSGHRLLAHKDGTWEVLRLRHASSPLPPQKVYNISYTRTQKPIVVKVPAARSTIMGAQPFNQDLVQGRRANVHDYFTVRPQPSPPTRVPGWTRESAKVTEEVHHFERPDLEQIREDQSDLTKRYWAACLQAAENGYVSAQVIAVLEALKVRCITKGEAITYAESRRLQVNITDRLKQCDISYFFPSLTGKVTVETLRERFAAPEGSADDRSTWDILSGDYKGATDLLRKSISEYILRKILEHYPEYNEPIDPQNAYWNFDCQFWAECPEPLQGSWGDSPDLSEIRRATTLGDLMVLCLTEHQMEYHFEGVTEFGGPKIKEDWEVRQERGQLMGSFLSFPILNIANLAVNLAFLHSRGVISKRSWKHAPLFVNGDDVLAMAPMGTFDGADWTDYVHTIGFVKSLGKNFVSPDFCTVNSILFKRTGPTDFEEVLGPRTEFLFNERWRQLGVVSDEPENKDERSKRGMSQDDDDYEVGPQMIGRLVHEVLDRVEPGQQEFILRSFIKSNLSHLKATKRPWFLPGDLGGLGLPTLPSMREEWLNDAYLASYLLRQAKTARVPDFNVAGVTLDSRKCDQNRSAISMQFIKSAGWSTFYKIDPTPEMLEVSKQKPKVTLDPTSLILTGMVPTKPTKRQLWKLHSAISKSTDRARQLRETLRPVELDRHTIRSLWRPSPY